MLEIAEEEIARMEAEVEEERETVKNADGWREWRVHMKLEEAKDVVEESARFIEGLWVALTARLAAGGAGRGCPGWVNLSSAGESGYEGSNGQDLTAPDLCEDMVKEARNKVLVIPSLLTKKMNNE